MISEDNEGDKEGRTNCTHHTYELSWGKSYSKASNITNLDEIIRLVES